MRASVIMILVLGSMAGSCLSPTGPVLKDGVLTTFDVNGKRYGIFITNPQKIDQVIALSHGQSNTKIPSGRVIKGCVHFPPQLDFPRYKRIIFAILICSPDPDPDRSIDFITQREGSGPGGPSGPQNVPDGSDPWRGSPLLFRISHGN